MKISPLVFAGLKYNTNPEIYGKSPVNISVGEINAGIIAVMILIG